MEKEIHILVIPYPIQGHINPILQFSKRLALKGPRVTFVTTTSISKSIQAHAYRSLHIETISDGSEEVENFESLDERLKRFKSTVSQKPTFANSKHHRVREKQELSENLRNLRYEPLLLPTFQN